MKQLIICVLLFFLYPLNVFAIGPYGVGGGGRYQPELDIEWWRDWDGSYNFRPGIDGRPPYKMWTVGKIDNRIDGPPASFDTSIANSDSIFDYEKDKIASLVNEGYTGNYWEIANEPNWWPKFSPDNYAYTFHLFCTYIKILDQNAKCVLGSLTMYDSNWQNWLDEFRSTYISSYGQEPPIDVWGIHPYDTFDQMAGQRSINKIILFRNYLDNSGQVNAVIWITEFGKGNWQPEPEQNIVDYINTVTNWLNTHHRTYKIERWFWWGALAGDTGMGANGLFSRSPYSYDTILPTGQAYLDQAQLWLNTPPLPNTASDQKIYLPILFKAE
ncbi:MAG: hypothetical protein HYR94_00585 [Chloroflexi bacterium]|nr:hypothetical protein [Chloroflexota bacterium]